MHKILTKPKKYICTGREVEILIFYRTGSFQPVALPSYDLKNQFQFFQKIHDFSKIKIRLSELTLCHHLKN